MSVSSVAFIMFFAVPILAGIVSGIVSDLSDRPTQAQIESWSSTTAINRPNFKTEPRFVQESPKTLIETQFETFDYHEQSETFYEDVPQFNEFHDSIESFSESISYEEDESILPELTQHSTPSKEAEKGIEELLTAVSAQVNNNVVPFKKTTELSFSDADVPPALEIKDETIVDTHPLGENWYTVASKFGQKVANKVTASPDNALQEGIGYVLFGKVEGEFLNCFGETVKLSGLPEDFKATDEFVLLQGSFVTTNLFHVMELMSAEKAAEGKEFEVLNVAFA